MMSEVIDTSKFSFVISRWSPVKIWQRRRDLDPRDLHAFDPAPWVGVELRHPAVEAAGRVDLLGVAVGGLEFQPFGRDVAERQAGARGEQRPGHIGADALVGAIAQNRLGGAA